METKDNNVISSLTDVVQLLYIDSENASFEEKDGFISLKLKDGEEEKEYKRIFLHRAFPHEAPDEYISVLDTDGGEVGMIKHLDLIEEGQRAILQRELSRKYFIFEVLEICSVSEKFGFSYWNVKTASGNKEFTLRDTYRSISKISEDRIFMQDVDGNRWHVTSLSALDRKSRKRIELYL